ncbi:unnamed protein product [Symbiodinium natans]|uniref:Uncharacterized protein n=1 Tax=Symbiodinium natans TaxID=878477 RepID=A0A812LWZ5_9DINO|nr:unnamed protein product [Symbiodinium natans]
MPPTEAFLHALSAQHAGGLCGLTLQLQLRGALAALLGSSSVSRPSTAQDSNDAFNKFALNCAASREATSTTRPPRWRPKPESTNLPTTYAAFRPSTACSALSRLSRCGGARPLTAGMRCLLSTRHLTSFYRHAPAGNRGAFSEPRAYCQAHVMYCVGKIGHLAIFASGHEWQ